MENPRRRIRALDGCLEYLELASERGVKRVPPSLANQVSVLVPAVSAGLPITQAIEFVFQAQEAALHFDNGAQPTTSSGSRSDSGRNRAPVDVTLDGVAARSLTERIKQGLVDHSLLLLEAHDRRAWRILGYPSWDAYARQEFGFSRSRSYELLDHGRVVRALMTAARLDAPPEISAFAAGQIKSRLGQAVAEITARAANQPGEEQAREIVRDVVTRMRAELKVLAPPGIPSETASPRVEARTSPITSDSQAQSERSVLTELHRAVDYLTGLSDPKWVVVQVKDSDHACLDRLREAAGRLIDIADAWERSRLVGTAALPRPPVEAVRNSGHLGFKNGRGRGSVQPSGINGEGGRFLTG